MRPLAIAVLLSLVLALAACGGKDRRSTTGTAAPPNRPKPVLVDFQRNGGLAATLDHLRVYRDGTAVLDKRYGGAGRRTTPIRLRPAVLARLRTALDHLPDRLAVARGGTRNGATYLLRSGPRTLAAAEGAVPAGAAPAFTLLNAITDGSGRAAG